MKDGQEVTETVAVLSDNAANLTSADPVVENRNDDTNGSGVTSGGINWYAEVNGVVYGPDEIVYTDVDTSLEWLKKIFGDKLSYDFCILDNGDGMYDGIVVYSSTYDNDCEALRILISIVKRGGYITSHALDSVFDSCGF